MSLGPLAGCITRHYYPLWIEGATLESDFYSARCSNEVQGGHETYQASASHTSKKTGAPADIPEKFIKPFPKLEQGTRRGGASSTGGKVWLWAGNRLGTERRALEA